MSYGNPIGQVGNTRLYVQCGDITRIETDAIMSAINPGGMWFGGIDGAIQRVAGEWYHRQAANAMPLRNLQTVVAKGSKANHAGEFDDVVFVVDALKSSLDRVVYTGLNASHNAGHSRLLIPTIRMGVMSGAVEKTPNEAVERLGQGITAFVQKFGGRTSLSDVAVVVYNDPSTARLLEEGLSSLKSN